MCEKLQLIILLAFLHYNQLYHDIAPVLVSLVCECFLRVFAPMSIEEIAQYFFLATSVAGFVIRVMLTPWELTIMVFSLLFLPCLQNYCVILMLFYPWLLVDSPTKHLGLKFSHLWYASFSQLHLLFCVYVWWFCFRFLNKVFFALMLLVPGRTIKRKQL